MPKRILIQLDPDSQPSIFDAVVAVDAGADVLLRHGGVTVDTVVPLVHGAMFTRGGADLASTAIFIGGSDVPAAERLFDAVRSTFFGPVRVGVLLDPSGANTTAAAAVVAAARHLSFDASAVDGCRAVVLGGTGPVGQRVARLLARKGVAVTIASRSQERAEAVAERIRGGLPSAQLRCVASGSEPLPAELRSAIEAADLIVAAGAAGVRLLSASERSAATRARVLIDLNAVPPAGIEGIAPTDKGRPDAAAVVYGPLGVGGMKMKIHRAAVHRLFEDASVCLDAEELLALGEQLDAAG